MISFTFFIIETRINFCYNPENITETSQFKCHYNLTLDNYTSETISHFKQLFRAKDTHYIHNIFYNANFRGTFNLMDFYFFSETEFVQVFFSNEDSTSSLNPEITINIDVTNPLTLKGHDRFLFLFENINLIIVPTSSNGNWSSNFNSLSLSLKNTNIYYSNPMNLTDLSLNIYSFEIDSFSYASAQGNPFFNGFQIFSFDLEELPTQDYYFSNMFSSEISFEFPISTLFITRKDNNTIQLALDTSIIELSYNLNVPPEFSDPYDDETFLSHQTLILLSDSQNTNINCAGFEKQYDNDLYVNFDITECEELILNYNSPVLFSRLSLSLSSITVFSSIYNFSSLSLVIYDSTLTFENQNDTQLIIDINKVEFDSLSTIIGDPTSFILNVSSIEASDENQESFLNVTLPVVISKSISLHLSKIYFSKLSYFDPTKNYSIFASFSQENQHGVIFAEEFDWDPLHISPSNSGAKISLSYTSEANSPPANKYINLSYIYPILVTAKTRQKNFQLTFNYSSISFYKGINRGRTTVSTTSDIYEILKNLYPDELFFEMFEQGIFNINYLTCIYYYFTEYPTYLNKYYCLTTTSLDSDKLCRYYLANWISLGEKLINQSYDPILADNDLSNFYMHYGDNYYGIDENDTLIYGDEPESSIWSFRYESFNVSTRLLKDITVVFVENNYIFNLSEFNNPHAFYFEGITPQLLNELEKPSFLHNTTLQPSITDPILISFPSYNNPYHGSLFNETSNLNASMEEIASDNSYGRLTIQIINPDDETRSLSFSNCNVKLVFDDPSNHNLKLVQLDLEESSIIKLNSAKINITQINRVIFDDSILMNGSIWDDYIIDGWNNIMINFNSSLSAIIFGNKEYNFSYSNSDQTFNFKYYLPYPHISFQTFSHTITIHKDSDIHTVVKSILFWHYNDIIQYSIDDSTIASSNIYHDDDGDYPTLKITGNWNFAFPDIPFVVYTSYEKIKLDFYSPNITIFLQPSHYVFFDSHNNITDIYVHGTIKILEQTFFMKIYDSPLRNIYIDYILAQGNVTLGAFVNPITDKIMIDSLYVMPKSNASLINVNISNQIILRNGAMINSTFSTITSSHVVFYVDISSHPDLCPKYILNDKTEHYPKQINITISKSSSKQLYKENRTLAYFRNPNNCQLWQAVIYNISDYIIALNDDNMDNYNPDGLNYNVFKYSFKTICSGNSLVLQIIEGLYKEVNHKKDEIILLISLSSLVFLQIIVICVLIFCNIKKRKQLSDMNSDEIFFQFFAYSSDL